jgi:hypothetical protein
MHKNASKHVLGNLFAHAHLGWASRGFTVYKARARHP